MLSPSHMNSFYRPCSYFQGNLKKNEVRGGWNSHRGISMWETSITDVQVCDPIPTWCTVCIKCNTLTHVKFEVHTNTGSWTCVSRGGRHAKLHSVFDMFDLCVIRLHFEIGPKFTLSIDLEREGKGTDHVNRLCVFMFLFHPSRKSHFLQDNVLYDIGPWLYIENTDWYRNDAQSQNKSSLLRGRINLTLFSLQ